MDPFEEMFDFNHDGHLDLLEESFMFTELDRAYHETTSDKSGSSSSSFGWGLSNDDDDSYSDDY